MRTSTTLAVVVLTGATIAAVAAILGGGVAEAASSSAATAAAGAPGTREPPQSLLARRTIWNTPVGAKARYVPARISSAGLGGNVLTGIGCPRDGSAMPGIGGGVRAGELTGRAPIRHALALRVSSRYLFSDRATGGVRWPAVVADGADRATAQRFTGSVRALRMGALLALPPAASARSLGVRSPAGRKVLAALRDYGGYVLGDTGRDTVDLCVDPRASVEFGRHTGRAVADDAGLRADLARMVGALAVIDDNGPRSIGGHGARRASGAVRAPQSPSQRAVSARVTASAGAPSPSAIATRQVAQLEPIRTASAPVVGALAGSAVVLLALGLWSGRRLAGGRRGL